VSAILTEWVGVVIPLTGVVALERFLPSLLAVGLLALLGAGDGAFLLPLGLFDLAASFVTLRLPLLEGVTAVYVSAKKNKDKFL